MSEVKNFDVCSIVSIVISDYKILLTVYCKK